MGETVKTERKQRQPFFTRGTLVIAGFSIAYLVGSALVAGGAGNNEFLFYTVMTSVFAGLVALLHWGVRFTTPLLALLSLWGAMHMAGGLIPLPESWPINGDQRVLYSWWIWPKEVTDGGAPGSAGGYFKYDHLVHAFGFGVTTWAVWQSLKPNLTPNRRGKLPTIGRMVLITAAGMGFGAFNEVLEFIATLMGPTNVGGYVNTSWDLVANLSGATLAAVLIYVFDRRRV